jgi:hypothetical protein
MLNSENGKQKVLLTCPAFERKNIEFKIKTTRKCLKEALSIHATLP